MKNSTTRFSGYSSNYEKYRPSYPAAILPWLQDNTGLRPGAAVADLGSGTGIFSRLLLEGGYHVRAVEPNAAMRHAAENQLTRYPFFTSIAGTAEATSLPDQSIDLITAAQAFHWFEADKVKSEFSRILRPGGHMLLVWNILRNDTPFLQKYQSLKDRYAAGLAHTHRANLDAIRTFFSPAEVVTHCFYHSQLLTREALQGYLQSFSTVPLPGDARHEPMMDELEKLFGEYNVAGAVSLDYETKAYLAELV